jgi:EmrB/QacA subfamily drug resistance transporter
VSRTALEPPAAPLHPRRWLAFAVALAAAMMDLIDASVANTAAPRIRADLGGSYADLQWIAAAYTLAMAVMLLTGARLGDMFGRRRMLLVGVGGFTAASLACAAAPSPEALIVCRALQGGLGAVMVPQVFGLIRDLFAPAEMGKAFGILGPVAGLSAMLGPIVAGLLIDADLLGTGWRLIFLVNVPVGVAVLVLGRRLLPAGAPVARGLRLDLGGVVLAGVGMFMLVFPLVQGRELGWPAWSLGLLAGSVGVLGALGRHVVRRRRAGATPLIEPSILSKPSYVAGVVFALVFLGAMGGIVLILGVFLQAGLGYTPIHASLTTAPWALGGFAGSAAAGMLMPRLGRRLLHAGLVVMAGGLLALCAVLAHVGTSVGSWDFTAPLLVSGLGMGAVFVPLFDIVMAGVEPREMGSASGVLQAMQQLGMSLGVAGVGTVFFGLLGARAGYVADFLHAAEVTSLVAVALLGLAFVVAFGLERGTAHAEPATGALEPVAA